MSPPEESLSDLMEGSQRRPRPVGHHLEWILRACLRCYLRQIQ